MNTQTTDGIIGGIILDPFKAKDSHERNERIIAGIDVPPGVRANYALVRDIYRDRGARVSNQLYMTHFVEGLWLMYHALHRFGKHGDESASIGYNAWLIHGLVQRDPDEPKPAEYDPAMNSLYISITENAGLNGAQSAINLARRYVDMVNLLLPRHMAQCDEIRTSLRTSIVADHELSLVLRLMIRADKIQNYVAFRRTMAVDQHAYTVAHVNLLQHYFNTWLELIGVGANEFNELESELNAIQ